MTLIALVDCSAFYCSCERLFRPDLRRRPVVVLSNNDGCIISRTAEAKALGIAMGTPYFKARRRLERDGVAVFSSNYALYGDLSRRVMSVLERFSPDVDVHSIDEAFLTLRAQRTRDGSPAPGERDRLAARADQIRATVLRATGIPVRVSIARTKTLAKAASEYARAHGQTVCFWGHPDAEAFLDALPIEDVWGVGPRWSARLRSEGVATARQFAALGDARLRAHYSIAALRTAWELRGIPCVPSGDGPVVRRTLVRSRSFGTATHDLAIIQEAIATHAARASEKLRAEGLHAGALQAFLTTGRHATPARSGALSAPFAQPTASPFEIVRLARRLVAACWRPADAAGRPYRYLKTGVLLTDLTPRAARQPDLFGPSATDSPGLLDAIDGIQRRYGRHAIVIAAQGGPAALARMHTAPGGRSWFLRRDHASAPCTTEWQSLPSVPSKRRDLAPGNPGCADRLV